VSTQIFCLGLSHRTAPIELRERLNYPLAELAAALAAYRDAGLGELVILSTCNRLELYAAVAQTDMRPVAAGIVPADTSMPPADAPMNGATTSAERLIGQADAPMTPLKDGGQAGATTTAASVLPQADAPMKGATTGAPQGVTKRHVSSESASFTDDSESVFTSLLAFVSATRGLPSAELSGKFYRLAGRDAIDHLGRVAAGLDSMVLGEPQILGQAAEAQALAAAQGAAGPVLSALFRAAVHAGKRARAETGISRNPSTISSVAVRLAEKAAGPLAERQVLVVGAGQMAELAVQALRGRGAARITLANRTLARAAGLAQRWGAQAVALDDLGAALAAADVAITATGAPGFVVSPEVAGPVLAARPERPLVLIDIAVPRDVDPAVRQLPNVRYYDIDDLEAHLNGALAERQQSVPPVEAIVAQEMGRFSAWLTTLAMAPVIADLRSKADGIRRAEVDKTLRRLPNLTPAERQQIERLSEALVNKLLHDPTVRLKDGRGHSAREIDAYAAAVRDLFALNG
jgi:glutamyl-tRNA reductase